MAISLTLTQAATAAAQFLGVLDSGETLSAQQLTDALAVCNNMVENWQMDPLMQYGNVSQTASLVSGIQSYTIGPLGVITPFKPLYIYGAAYINSAGLGSPIEIVTLEKWSSLPDRQARSFSVKYLYYDRGGAVGLVGPYGIIFISPVPLGGQIELYYTVSMFQFADTTTALTEAWIPPGYVRLIKLGLAIEWAPQFSVTPSPNLVSRYEEAKAAIRNMNAQIWGNAAVAKSEADASMTAQNPPRG